MKVEIFLTNLTKYNAGELVGRWVEVKADTDWSKLESELGQAGDEFFITDYKAPFHIGEFENPRKISEIVMSIEGNTEVFSALSKVYDKEYALDLIESGNYSFSPDILTYEDLARDRIADTRPEEFEGYFKWEEYGETIAINEGGNLTEWGYVVAY